MAPAPSYDAIVKNFTDDVAGTIDGYIVGNPNSITISVSQIPPRPQGDGVSLPNPHEIRNRIPQYNNVNIQSVGKPGDYCLVGYHVEGYQYTNNNNWMNGRPYYLYSNTMGGEVTWEEFQGGVSTLSCVQYGNQILYRSAKTSICII